MRKFQITVFVLATAALLAAAGCIGKAAGEEFRKIGAAALLFDIVCLLLWPSAHPGSPGDAGSAEREIKATPGKKHLS